MTAASRRTFAARALLAAVACLVAILAAEMAARIVDRYRLTSLELVAAGPPILPASDRGKWTDPRQAAAYAARVPRADGVDFHWFALDPDPLPPMPIDDDLMRRYQAARGHELASVYEWNQQFLSAVLCAGERATHPYLASQLESLTDAYVFTPPGGTPFPPYRFLPSAHYPSGLRTNSFGWRGPEIPAHKPSGRVRVAFVGASTTADAHADPFSYPEYIGRWLQAWAALRHPSVSFDIVNAGREGVLSNGIAAIVRDELLPVRPDLVVYYEGANQFWPNDYVARPIVRAFRVLNAGPAVGRHSALAARLRNWMDRSGTGREPRKPPITVDWPSHLDEFDPPLDDPRLPVQLPQILNDLDRMRRDLQTIDATLMPSSFVWLVDDHLVLEPGRDAVALEELNQRYWPFSYAHLRRFVDVENRTFRKYAAQHGLPFNDLDAEYPRDPRLFVDTVHMTPAGVKLKAWIVFQHVVAALEPGLQSHRLPRADVDESPGRVEPARTPRRLESVAAVKARCGG